MESSGVNPEQRVIKFKQFDKVVQGKVVGNLLEGDFEVELLEDAPPLSKGTVISVAKFAIIE